MSINSSIDAVKKLLEKMEFKQFDEISEIVHPEYKLEPRGKGSLERIYRHEQLILDQDYEDMTRPGGEALSERLEFLLGGLSNLQINVHDISCTTPDKVWVDLDFRGIHNTEVLGIPPTNDVIEWRSVLIYKLKDGMIYRSDVFFDWFSLLSQLGIIKFSDFQDLSANKYLSVLRKLKL